MSVLEGAKDIPQTNGIFALTLSDYETRTERCKCMIPRAFLIL